MMFWMLSTFISWLEESIFLNKHPPHTKTSQKRRKITAQFQTSASEGNVVLTCTFPIKTIAVSLAKFLCIRWNLNFPRPQTSCFPYRNFLMTRNNSKPLSLRFILNEIHFYTHAYYQNLFAEASFTWHLKFLCECIILFSVFNSCQTSAPFLRCLDSLYSCKAQGQLFIPCRMHITGCLSRNRAGADPSPLWALQEQELSSNIYNPMQNHCSDLRMNNSTQLIMDYQIK